MEALEEQLRSSREEKTCLWEENARLKKDILALRHQLSLPATTEAGLGESRPPAAQAALGGTDGEVDQGPPGEKLLQQQEEEMQQLRNDVHRVQNLCRSTEKELRHEREKSLQLKKHNISLQQENIKVKAELRQVQLKLSESSEACSSLTSQGELVRQQVQELQLELLKESQAAKQQQRSLQEKLAQEKARVAEAGRTIAELQQTLREKKQQLEGEVKEAQEKQTKAQRQLLEEQQKRKILDQQAENLQQQLRLAREKEAQLARTCAEGQLQAQQLQAQLRVLEEEKRTLSNEHLHCQKYSQKLTEQLLARQQEKEATNEELERILEQVDLAVRKNNERKLRHKAKLRRAKETFLSEMKQRDLRIRHLEKELKLAQSQREENQALIRRMATENEGLLQKKTKLSQRLLDLEEADRSHQQVFSAMQSRLHLFNEENKRLQGRILQLTHQVGALERTLRNIHSHNVEELKSIGFSECQLQTQMGPLPGLSLSVRELPDSRTLLKSVEDGRAQEPAEKPLLSPSSFPSPEIGYLNVASPGEPGDLHQEKPAQPFCCDQAQRTGEDL